MTDTPEAVRLEFERYFLESRKSKGTNRNPTFERFEDGTYKDDHTQRHWWTWQNALLRRIPEIETEIEAAKLGEAFHDKQANEYARRVAHWIGKFDEVKAERDQLRAELEKVRVPDGWKLVPVEPTREMLDRGSHNVNCNYHYGTMETIAKHAYKAMLAATPTPPAQAAADARDAERWRMAVLIQSETLTPPDHRKNQQALNAYIKALPRHPPAAPGRRSNRSQREAGVMVPLISSQRYLDPATVARKARTFKVFIVNVLEVSLRGRPYRVLIDGHHNLAAARMAGVEPTWRGAPRKFDRIFSGITQHERERFLINNLTDSDWYYVDTGAVVNELLTVEKEPTP